MTIGKIIANTEAINIEAVLQESFEQTAAELKQYQIGQQLHGLDADGKQIGKYANKAYAAKKYSMNPLAGYGNIDLEFTKELHNDTFVDVRATSVVFASGAPHFSDVYDKWPNAWGLNAAYRSEYGKSYLQPAFVNKFKSKLFL